MKVKDAMHKGVDAKLNSYVPEGASAKRGYAPQEFTGNGLQSATPAEATSRAITARRHATAPPELTKYSLRPRK